jgi:outer membrane murein-binding lipoprotein Lpp
MRKFLLVTAIGALGVLTLAGCGAVDKVKDAADDVQNAADNAQEAQKRFEERNAKREKATFTVTYETDEDTEFTYAQSPPRSVYITEDTQIINDDGTVTTCTDVDTDEPECIESDTQVDDFYGFYGAQFFAGFGDLFSAVPGLDTETSDETIAGRDAECTTIKLDEVFGISTGAEDGSITTCYDADTGVVLRALTTDKDGKKDVGIEATEFSDDADDELFEPAAKPKTVDEKSDEYKDQLDDLKKEIEDLTTTTTKK